MRAFGFFSVKVSRVDADYSEYLGPDWKPNHDLKAGIMIKNHAGGFLVRHSNITFQDVLVDRWLFHCSFFSKVEVKDFICIGKIAQQWSTLFLDRMATPEEKKKGVDDITQRAKEAAEGRYPPLMIYVEGGTTNGTRLNTFRKGAFAGL